MVYRLSAALPCAPMKKTTGPNQIGANARGHSPETRKLLGSFLVAARVAAGFTQEGAAKDLGLVKQTISSWEKGRNLPDALWLQKLADLYETSMDALAGYTPVSQWPFSDELQARVRQLTEYKRLALEAAIWVHLEEPVPQDVNERLHRMRAAARAHIERVSTPVARDDTKAPTKDTPSRKT